MRNIERASAFKRDYRKVKAKSRYRDLDERLIAVLELLVNDRPLPLRNPGSLRVTGEQHAAIGGHRGLAAGGVVGQDRHDVAAGGAKLVAVVDPAGAVHFA